MHLWQTLLDKGRMSKANPLHFPSLMGFGGDLLMLCFGKSLVMLSLCLRCAFALPSLFNYRIMGGTREDHRSHNGPVRR